MISKTDKLTERAEKWAIANKLLNTCRQAYDLPLVDPKRNPYITNNKKE